MRERGSGLLDAIAATGVALTLGAVAGDLVGAARTIDEIATRERALTHARNALEHATATPCAAPVACEAGLDCTLTTESLAAPAAGVERVTVHVRFDDDADPIRLATLRPSGCGGPP